MGRIQRAKQIELTADDIISGFCFRALSRRGPHKVYPNYYIGPWECDILEITKAGYTYEYEVKISRNDFNVDFKKQNRGSKKHDVLKAGDRVNYFSFVVPEGLIDPSEVPEFAGLIYVRGCEGNVLNEKGEILAQKRVLFSTVKEPQKLKADKITPEEIEAINHRIYYRYHMIRLKLAGSNLKTD